jgi:hypothetical protein
LTRIRATVKVMNAAIITYFADDRRNHQQRDAGRTA